MKTQTEQTERDPQNEKPDNLPTCRGVQAVKNGYSASFVQSGKTYYLGRYISYSGAAIAILNRRVEIFLTEGPQVLQAATKQREMELKEIIQSNKMIIGRKREAVRMAAPEGTPAPLTAERKNARVKLDPDPIALEHAEAEKAKTLITKAEAELRPEAIAEHIAPLQEKRITEFTSLSKQLYQYNLAAFKTGVDIRETKAEKPHQGQPGQPGYETEQERRIRLDEAKQERKNRQIEEEINEATDKHLLDTLTYLKFITSLHTDRTPVVIETEYRAQQLRSQMAARKRIRQNKKDSTKKLKAERKQELINLRNQEEELF